MKTSAFGEGRNTSLAVDGLPQQLDSVGVIEKAPVLFQDCCLLATRNYFCDIGILALAAFG
jgi:hypothetical protein